MAQIISPAKTAVIRLHLIHKEIEKGSYPNRKYLAEKFGVEELTISRDIDDMKAMGAPIDYDRRKKGYYYTDNTFRLTAAFASAEDLLAIELVKELMELYRDTPVYESVYNLLRTISIPLDDDQYPDWHKNKIIIPKIPAVPVDPGVWQCILTGLKENRIISFDYFSASAHATIKYDGSGTRLSRRTVRPYQLLYDRSAWYLSGFDEDRDDKRIYSVTRMSGAQVTDKIFSPGNAPGAPSCSPDNNYEEKTYFGLFPYLDTYKFVIEIFGDVPWIREIKWASDQKIEKTENGIHLSFTSHQFDKVLDFILSLGSNARPLEPELLVKKWRDTLKEMVELIADP